MNDNSNVPMDATAMQADAVIKAAIAWRLDNDGGGLMSRAEWELFMATNAYGDKFKGTRGK